MAWFTDSDASVANTFTTGTLDIGLVGNDGTSKIVNLGNISNFAPGDSTAEGTVTLTNNGSLDLAFIGGLKLIGSDVQKDLAKKLVIKKMQVQLIPKVGSPIIPNSADQAVFIENGVGVGLYGTAYNNASYYGYTGWNNVAGKITLADWVGAGSGITGVNQCFWKQALKPGWSWKYTFQFTFDGSATNALQGTQMGLQFIVQAAQVKEEAVVEALGILGFPNSSTYIEMNFLNDDITAQD